MDDPYATTQLTAEGSTWELRSTRPEWGGGVPSVEYDLVRVSGDTTLSTFAVELRDNGTGEVYGRDKYPRLSSAPPASGTLYGRADAESLLLALVGFPAAGDQIDIGTIPGLEVPERPDTGFEMVDSPISIPTWAAPMGDSIAVSPPGDPGAWTEAVVESIDLTHRSGFEVEYSVTVGSVAVLGEAQDITRSIRVGTGKAPPSFLRSATWPSVTAEVTIPPGESVTIEGSLTLSESDPTFPIQAFVVDTGRDLPEIEYETGTDPFDLNPQDRIKIPAPVDTEQLLQTPSIAAEAVDSPVDGYTYYGSRTNLVPDKRFITALLDYRAGRIGDLQMARLHALYQQGGVEQNTDLAASEPPREGAPVLVGMDDSGTVHIHNDREAQPDLFGYGPLFAYDDTDFGYPRGPAPGSPLHSVTGLLGGREYVFGYDEGALESYNDPLPDLTLRTTGTVAIPEPEPPESDPDPDPDPEPEPPETVEPPLDVACDFSDTEITPGGSVTIPADVTAGDGTTETSGTVVIEVAGEQATETVTLSPNSSTRVEATFEISESGEYQPTVTLQ